MARYIDADEVLKNAHCLCDYLHDTVGCDGCRECIEVISVKEVICAPTADVKPVVHGEWLKNDPCSGWRCSICGEADCYAYDINSLIYDGDYRLQDYFCPNCGADMRGEKK